MDTFRRLMLFMVKISVFMEPYIGVTMVTFFNLSRIYPVKNANIASEVSVIFHDFLSY